MTIFDIDNAKFSHAYPDSPCSINHRLHDHKDFTIEALAELAEQLPQNAMEWNSGALDINQAPELTPGNNLTAAETIRQIAHCASWIVLKNVEQSAVYKKHLLGYLNEIRPLVEQTTGDMHKPQAYIFVSSHAAVTPFHMDPEHNILMQVSGEKRMTIYPKSTLDTLPAEEHEAYHAGIRHRNLPYQDDYEALGQTVTLTPGAAIYVPVKAPHRVENGDKPSISFSITWRSAISDQEATLHRANGTLRRRFGMKPPLPGARPVRDRTVLLGYRAAQKAGFIKT